MNKKASGKSIENPGAYITSTSTTFLFRKLVWVLWVKGIFAIFCLPYSYGRARARLPAFASMSAQPSCHCHPPTLFLPSLLPLSLFTTLFPPSPFFLSLSLSLPVCLVYRFGWPARVLRWPALRVQRERGRERKRERERVMDLPGQTLDEERGKERRGSTDRRKERECRTDGGRPQ